LKKNNETNIPGVTTSMQTKNNRPFYSSQIYMKHLKSQSVLARELYILKKIKNKKTSLVKEKIAHY
jgi:hypothetical protein